MVTYFVVFVFRVFESITRVRSFGPKLQVRSLELWHYMVNFLLVMALNFLKPDIIPTALLLRDTWLSVQRRKSYYL